MHNDNEERVKINDYLNSLEHNFQGKPIFRLTWAEDEWEHRFGDFNEFTKSGLFKRTIRNAIKRTPKYPQLRGLYIIEQLFDMDRVRTESIRDHNGYECIYCFRDAKFNALPLRLVVVQLVIKAVKSRTNKMLFKSRQNEIDEAIANRAAKKDFELINEDSFLITQLHDREAVSLAGLGEKIDAAQQTSNASITSKSGK